jgi:hypothetical protein
VRPAVGIAAVNLGSDIEWEFGIYSDKERLPKWFNYGASVRIDGPLVTLGSVDVPALSATLDLDGNHGLNEQRPQWGFGYEVALMEIASVRWGRRIDDNDRTPADTWGVGLGVPVGPVRARVEYAQVSWTYWSSFYDPPHRTSRDIFGVTLAWLFEGAGE